MGDYVEELEYERKMKDQFMAHHRDSPFVQGRVHDFDGLRYFPIDPRFRVKAKLVRERAPEEAYLRTNRDGQAVMRYLGDLSFRLEGRSLRLRLYHAGEGIGTSVFVPFRDATSGNETYGPGRYVTLELNEDDVYDLDFNRAFNPYCAYTDEFECGFPPAENDLPVAVAAGEKVWSQERNPLTPSSAMPSLARRRTTAASGTASRPHQAARAGARKPRTRARATPRSRR